MSADPEPDVAQRLPIGTVRCSLCGHGILRISDLAKEVVASGVAVLHRQCYDALAPKQQRGRRRASRADPRRPTVIRAAARR